MDAISLVINLQRATERMAFQRRQLEQLALPFERIEAVDAGTIPQHEFEARSHQWERPLCRNEIACFFSHRLAWQRIIAERRPMLVLEDDAVLSQHLTQVLSALQLPSAPLRLNLEASRAAKLVATPVTSTPVAGHTLRRIYYDRGGSAAYILTPQAAEIALERSHKTAAQADAFLNHLPKVKAYQFVPALAVQLHFLKPLLPGSIHAAAQSSNARPQGEEKRLSIWLKHPAMKLRRLRTNIAKSSLRMTTLRCASRRKIEWCPTIGQQAIAIASRASA